MSEKCSDDQQSKDRPPDYQIIGKKYGIQETSPLLTRHSAKSRTRYKVKCLLITLAILLLIVLIIVLAFYLSTYLSLNNSPATASTQIMTENTTIEVGSYTVRKQENAVASIEEKVLDDDAFHVNTFVIVPSSQVVVHNQVFKENGSIIPTSDDAIAVDHRYVYMLSSSVMNYTICLGNASKSTETKFYVFDSEESYKNFISSPELLTTDSIFSKKFTIGGRGNIICSQALFTTNTSGYYFFVLKAKYANTYINYTVIATLNRLSIKDYLMTRNYNSCRIEEKGQTCSIGFSGERHWTLIGSSDRNYDFYSRINHVQVTVTRSSDMTFLYQLLFYGSIVLCSLTLLAVVVTAVLFVCVVHYSKRSSKPTPYIVNSYS